METPPPAGGPRPQAENTGLEAALKNVGKVSNDINKELGQIEKGLKFDPSNTVLLGQKQELLGSKITETRKALDRAKGVLQQQLSISEPEAFRWIQKTAMDLRLSMRQVAEGVVEHGPSVGRS